MITRRAKLGGTILAAWLAGLAVLVQRQYFRPQTDRLVEAAAHVQPGAVYFGVMQNGQQIGFASSTIDTTEATISVADYVAADVLVDGKPKRRNSRTNVTLSRAMRVKQFAIAVNVDGPQVNAGGRVDGDSVLVFARTAGTQKADSQRVALSGPILLPTLVPLAVALGERPKVGKRYYFPVLDPSSMSPKNVAYHVLADSLFTLNDSAVFDSTTSRWRGVKPDTVRAWRLSADANSGGASFDGWIDEEGRVVETRALGFELKRLPYEVAWENWRADSGRVAATDDRDFLETSLIAANRHIDKTTTSLRVRLSGASLVGFDINGQRQRLIGDTLAIMATPDSAMNATYKLPMTRRGTTPATPPLQGDEKRMFAMAKALAKESNDPRIVADRINSFVAKWIRREVVVGAPSVWQTWVSHKGDCTEHTQLFVALAQSIGLSARVATGAAYVDGKFYYHVWPEVFLRDWVAVDPTFGQFPADAAHIRFATGEDPRQAGMQRLFDNLKVDVISIDGKPVPQPSSNLK